MNRLLNIVLGKGYKVLNRVRDDLDNRSIEVLMDAEIEKHLKSNKKTVLYVGYRYDYGDRSRGLSWEHYNCYHSLLNMDYSLIYFDYDRIMQKYGAEKMSQMLHEAVYCYQPDILFYWYAYDWVKHGILKEVSDELPTKTIIWLTDDHFQYEETRPIWELFNLVVTTDRAGYEKGKRKVLIMYY
jgi:hypothetical protein